MVEQPESTDTAVDPSTADSDDSEQSDPEPAPDGDRPHSGQPAVDEADETAEGGWPAVGEADETAEGEWPAVGEADETVEGEWPAVGEADETAEGKWPAVGETEKTAEAEASTVDEVGETAEAEASTADEAFASDGPESDQEMPLADHIEEMMRRLGIVFLVAGIVTVVVYPLAGETINFLWSAHIPESPTNRPRLYGPLEFILTKLKVAGLAGVLVGLPVFVYQTYRFMRPGLYQQERRYYLAAVPTSLVLGIFGVLFAHYLILPLIFSYFTTYTTEAAVIAFGLQETFNLILLMMGWMALVFQIPLFIMLAIMMGLVTRRWLETKRLIFWGAFVGIAFIFSPDPTGMAPIMVALTMVGLFEGTLALLRWTGN